MNRIILSGLVFAAILAVGFSALCTPDQWEGYEGSRGGYIHHRHPGTIKEFARVSYDAKNKRKATFINYVNDDYENKFQMIVRYDDDNDDTGKAYVVDLKKNKCWKKTLKAPFRKCCIPDDAKHMGDFYFGLKGGMLVSDYEVKAKGLDVHLSVSKAGDSIIPVTENIQGRIFGTAFIQGIGFLDITPGIKNASVFDVPKQCSEDNDASVSEYLMREHYILAV